MNPAGAKHTLEITTPTDNEVVMTRAFDAPRNLVFDAFTKPELIRRWLLGPDGWEMPVCDVDLRAGGTFHYVWRNDAEDREFGLHGTYHEIDAPSRIVHVENFDQSWYPDDATVTTAFTEQDGTTRVSMTIFQPSREARDQMLASGMDKGVARSFDRLAEILAGE
jgi:uncharacterized protein YndB with AHSA1/START domain